METFLKRTAIRIEAENQEHLNRLELIFPNRRSSLVFKKHWLNLPLKNNWVPFTNSFEDYMLSKTSYVKAEPFELLLQLYKVFTGPKKSLRDFIPLGQQLLKDFNEIDMHLLDAAEVFSYLTEAKAIASWNLSENKLTDSAADYLQFFQALTGVYSDLKDRQQQTKQGQMGHIYREMLEQGFLSESFQKHFIFIGFNAFTPVEEKLIKKISQEHKVEYYFDADAYYLGKSPLSSLPMEAGKHLRAQQSKSRNNFRFIGQQLLKGEKNIMCTGAAGAVGMVKTLHHFFRGVPENEWSETCVVLTHEELLPIALNELSHLGIPANVSMGKPMIELELPQLTVDIAQLAVAHESATIPNERLLRKVLTHKFLKPFFTSDLTISRIKTSDFKQYRASWIPELNPLKEAHALFLFFPASSSDFLHAIINWLAEYTSYEASDRLHAILSKYVSATAGQKFSLSDCESILSTIFRQYKTPYLPIQGGIQLMGFLESRCLDFKHLCIFPVNEGHLPSDASFSSLIPLDLRKHFGLPTPSYRDAISAYHFYRLLQSAQNIQLTYNTEPGERGGGDISRYINQVKHELAVVNPRIKFAEEIFVPGQPSHSTSGALPIPNHNQIQKRVLEIFNEGVSASMLSRFFECRIRFIYHDVYRLRKEEKLLHWSEADFGNLVHKSAEILYKPFLNHELNRGLLSEIRKKIPETLPIAAESISSTTQVEGLNQILIKLAANYLNKLIDWDMGLIKQGPLAIKGLEKKISGSYKFNRVTIKIQGIIDRIDFFKGKSRLIDLKTGKIKTSDLQIKSLDDVSSGKKTKFLQLLTYFYLARVNDLIEEEDTAGIFGFLLNDQPWVELRLPEGPDQAKAMFEAVLQTFVKELMNESSLFEPTSITHHCKNCDYRDICRRNQDAPY